MWWEQLQGGGSIFTLQRPQRRGEIGDLARMQNKRPRALENPCSPSCAVILPREDKSAQADAPTAGRSSPQFGNATAMAPSSNTTCRVLSRDVMLT